MFTSETATGLVGSRHLCRALKLTPLRRISSTSPLTRTSVPIINVCSVTLHHKNNIKNNAFHELHIHQAHRQYLERSMLTASNQRTNTSIKEYAQGRFNMAAAHYHRRISKPIADTYIHSARLEDARPKNAHCFQGLHMSHHQKRPLDPAYTAKQHGMIAPFEPGPNQTKHHRTTHHRQLRRIQLRLRRALFP